jgi:hypothetical protein
MDRRVIEAKLERLRRCVQRIEHKQPSTLELQDILSVNLERAVHLGVDIAAHIIADREVNVPMTMAAAFSTILAPSPRPLCPFSPRKITNHKISLFTACCVAGYLSVAGVMRQGGAATISVRRPR